MIHASTDFSQSTFCGCSSVVEHLLAKERVESSNLFIRFSILVEKLQRFSRLNLSSYRNRTYRSPPATPTCHTRLCKAHHSGLAHNPPNICRPIGLLQRCYQPGFGAGRVPLGGDATAGWQTWHRAPSPTLPRRYIVHRCLI